MVLILIFTLIILFLVPTIFVWQNFSVCFIEGDGLDVFKKINEYIMCIIFLISERLPYKNRNLFEGNVYNLDIDLNVLYHRFRPRVSYISNYGLQIL